MISRTHLTAQRLRDCRIRTGETLEQLGNFLGVNKTTILRWERGDTARINRAVIETLARHYQVDPDWLTGEKDVSHAADAPWIRAHAVCLPHAVNVPVLGSVRAGQGGWAQEEIIGHETVQSEHTKETDQLFWLQVSGDSMSPSINENDLVLVRRQPTVPNGSFAVVIVDGEEGLVKKVCLTAQGIELHSINPYYPVRRFEGKDAERVLIVGPVLELKRRFC